MFLITTGAKNLYSCSFYVLIIYRLDESICTSPSNSYVLILSKYRADIHFLLMFNLTICVLPALCLSLEKVGLHGFDSFYDRPSSTVLWSFVAAAESVHSVLGPIPLLSFTRVQGCHALCLWPFSSLSASALLLPGGSTMRTLLQPLLLLFFTTTSLYSKVTVFLIFTSMSLGFLMLHKRCIFSSSWQSSLSSFEACKLWVCSCLTVGTWVVPWLPQGTEEVHDSLVPCLVLYSNSKRQMWLFLLYKWGLQRWNNLPEVTQTVSI